MRGVRPTRYSVVEAAREWLDGRDPAEVTPREIARALGMVPTALYRYFDSTADLQSAIRGSDHGEPATDRPMPLRAAAPPHTRRFAEAFIARAAGPEQASTLIARLVGDTISVGPEQVGPKGRATAFATGRVGAVTVTPLPGASEQSMILTIPAALTIEVRLGRRYSKQFGTNIAVPLRITPRITDPLQLDIEVRRPQPQDLVVDIELARFSVALLQAVGNIDTLLRERIIEFIDGVLDSPEGQAATRVDLGRVIDDAWNSGLVFP